MKKALIALGLATTILPVFAKGKDARCVIKQGGEVAYAGRCLFNLDKGGSFTVTGIGANKSLILHPGMAR
jgi:hypothetical protein